jgi:hypothetical protein
MQFPTTSGAAPQDIELAAISQRVFQPAPTDQRQVMVAGAAVEPHARPVLPSDNPKTIVLDLVQPIAAGRQF